jgi:hypothetical protein
VSPATSLSVECWLFEKRSWVTTDSICYRFDISERRLRHLGEGFLVSRPRGGYIHRYHATPAELEAYCGPELAHSRSLRRKIFLIRKLYRERVRPYPVDSTGQPVLL